MSGQQLFCPFRRKYVRATPEEKVRQAVLRSLVDDYGFPASLIAVEAPIEIGNHVDKRCDAIVYSPNLEPWMLIELKAPSVPITQKTLDQAAIYNTTLHAPLLLLSNSQQTICARCTDTDIEFLKQIPSWSQSFPSTKP